MRKLATIAIIDKLEPIPNADRILKATVRGWECVVSRSDNFNAGDKVIYIEVDSVLPAEPQFDFLKDRKYRIRTIKLRGQVSQGLILPLSYLKDKNRELGDDVTQELGIKKYDPQAEIEKRRTIEAKPKNKFLKWFMQFEWFRTLFNKFSIANCKFPTEVVAKTDEERIQNLPTEFEMWKRECVPFYATEKIDGCSATFFLHEGKFGVCSRNIWLRKEDDSYYWDVARRFELKRVLKELSKEFNNLDVVIQGEIIGQGIQGNKYKVSGYELFVFNIVVGGKKLDQELMTTLCKKYKLNSVPLIYKGTTLPSTIHDIVEMSKGKSKLLATQEREGLVWRNYDLRISFKAINPTFLLKNSED